MSPEEFLGCRRLLACLVCFLAFRIPLLLAIRINLKADRGNQPGVLAEIELGTSFAAIYEADNFVDLWGAIVIVLNAPPIWGISVEMLEMFVRQQNFTVGQ